MKKILILVLLTIFLSGCGIFNLNGWVVPDDEKFLAVVEELDTPEKISDYMGDNFTYKLTEFYSLTPYQLWLTKEGDCNDFCTFALFIAEYHDYETYYILIHFVYLPSSHVLGVYLENGQYTYSNNMFYNPIYVSSFDEVISYFFTYNCDYKLKSYKVYDYDMNLIEQVTR